MRMDLIFRLFFLSFSLSLAVAQSTTSSIVSHSTTRVSNTLHGTTTLPVNGTTTLSANGTATATIANGTITLSSTPTSTATYPSLSGVSSCVTSCLTVSVAASNCSSITETNCYCPKSIFRNTTVQCVSSQCPSDLSNAESVAQQFCNIASVTVTFPSPTASGTIPLSTSSPAPPPPTGTTTRNGAENTTPYWPSIFTLFGITALTMAVFGIW